jgi:hypothetical protein
MIFNKKKYEEFDSYEKTVFDWLSGSYQYMQKINKVDDDSVYEYVEKAIIQNDVFKHIHYNDLWDLVTFVNIQMAQSEYSGNLIVVPDFMERKIKEHMDKMCCGIYYGRYTAPISKRKYLIAFDYGH